MTAAYTLHEGDCRLGLAATPDDAADVTITDPPYSAHVHASFRSGDKSQGKISKTTAMGFASLAPAVMLDVATHLARVTRRWVLVFSDVESCHLWRDALIGAGLEYIRTLSWEKMGGAPQFTGDRPAAGFETITLCHRRGKKRWNGGGRQGVYRYSVVGAGVDLRCHPTQKPLSLMEALVRDFSDPGELVLDPFAGAGTTGVAALSLGRRFLGWELDPAHAATAQRRLAEVRPQLELPTAKRPKAKQLGLGSDL